MNYEFAALDFIIDKRKTLYFIEANSSPGALTEYKKAYLNSRPVQKLCGFLNKDFKHMAVISKKNWDKSKISKVFRKYFKGKITFCPYDKNKANMLKGNGSLLSIKNKKILPDVVLRVAAGKATAQEKAGIKVINPYCISRLTINKIKIKKIVKKHTNIKVPRFFRVNKKSDIKTILNKNKKLFSYGFILKPKSGHKSEGVIISHSYEKIPKKFKIKRPYIIEEIIQPYPLFKREFFEIRSMAVSGKYAGSMLFVSPKRPMHLFKEGRTERIPKKLEIKIKKATEKIVKVIEKESKKSL